MHHIQPSGCAVVSGAISKYERRRPRNDDDRNVRIDVVDHAAAEIRGEPANDHTIQ